MSLRRDSQRPSFREPHVNNRQIYVAKSTTAVGDVDFLDSGCQCSPDNLEQPGNEPEAYIQAREDGTFTIQAGGGVG